MVTRGAPDKEFRLDCPACEGYLKGDRKQRILKTTPGDPKAGIPAKQERVADADPLWSSAPDSVPLTPDEAAVNHVRAERGTQQIQMLQALAAIRATGVNIPVEAMWLLEKELPTGILHGTMLCVNGHDNAAGAKFCAECGSPMSARAQVEAPPEAVIPLDRLHVQTLRKICREKDLPDKGTKDELIMRLEAA
jgi:hypothetical protein